MGVQDPQVILISNIPYNPFINKYGGDLTGGGSIYVDPYYLPASLFWIGWDYPSIAHTGIDVAYKLTGYDWLNRSLTWSVQAGPGGMTIDADGTLHWTPSAEGTQAVTVKLQAGSQSVTKTFNIEVNNSKVVFVDPAGDDANDGSIGSPLQSLLAAVGKMTISGSSGVSPRLVYFRAGTTVADVATWGNTTVGNPYRNMQSAVWSNSNFPILRNYPGEAPVISFTGAGVPGLTFGGYVSIQGLILDGGSAAENASVNIFTYGAVKNVVATNYQAAYTGNCTGIKVGGGSIVDSVWSHSNYDRANTTHHNSSNYLFYGTSAGGDAFIIDSISSDSVIGFKIKHAGSTSRLHVHRSVSYGCKNNYGGASNRSSVRHSMFYRSATVGDSGAGAFCFGLALTDPSTGGEINNDKGMLVDHCDIVDDDATSSIAFTMASYVFNTGYPTPAALMNCNITTAGSSTGCVFNVDQYQALPAEWTASFIDNAFVSAGDGSNIAIMGQGTSYDVAQFNARGSGNTWSATRADLTKTIAGAVWTYDESASQFLKDGVAV